MSTWCAEAEGSGVASCTRRHMNGHATKPCRTQRLNAHTNTDTRANTHTQARPHTRINTHAHACAQRAHIHTRTHTHIHAHTSTRAHTHTYMHTQARAHTHTCTHTHTHTPVMPALAVVSMHGSAGKGGLAQGAGRGEREDRLIFRPVALAGPARV